ncbi:NADP-dependent 3-hydroxy acid dehydrogenase YdfG [Aurantimicrobium minutum]|uniref:SDR family oxidoreductase n=1 Tax=Aurantimicrobium minutum TaxID=708131 RepID=UPI002473E041|nr:SDR family oxidoreductase [Aurantimicrobium minutum]MDH6532465.1 NADP-dependent 3-hydroxy acid dehydrogenase YdfG [Aurantimicrobium minutum]
MSTRRVVITGASSGIGQATARLCAARGWQVVGVARRADRLAQLAAETGMDTFVADVTQQSDVDSLRDYLAQTGPVHSLVNNAGGAIGTDSVEDSNPADWMRMFDVNVLGVQRVTSALLPLLRKGSEGGHADIMTVTSTAGFVPYEGGGGYNAAKFALHGVVGVLRLELAGEPIRVMEIAPGMVKTDEFALNRFGGNADKVDALYGGVLEPLVAEDIAEAIVHALELPGHVNMDQITIRPVAQAAQHKLIRGELKAKA